MSVTVNPILPPTSLLRPQMPDIYLRSMIYDPTWDNPTYGKSTLQQIVPAVGSLVRDVDDTPLWVAAIDDVTLIPTYTVVPLSTENENVVSLLNYGNTVLRLYVDYRTAPYPASPDPKCIFIGKSPRTYTLTRYPNTAKESIISQYYDSNGKLLSQAIPLVALDEKKNSWYLPRCHLPVILEDNEEVQVKVFSEDGSLVYTALLHTKTSSVINEQALYSPTIVAMTVSGLQQLADGTFYLHEQQDFDALGLLVTLTYSDGSTAIVPVDGSKCILYGQEDFISSFAGLIQFVTVKYYRSSGETIAPGLQDPTGTMVSISVPVKVIPSALQTTNKILVIPTYNASLARYLMRYWNYFADGRGYVDVTPFVSIVSGDLDPTSNKFGVQQTYVVSVDMANVDPFNYPTQAKYQQNVVLTLNSPTVLVKWTLKDSATSPYILGQDNAQSRRPSLRYDATRKQYFIPTGVFGNSAAFINSFYTQAAPPYDPSVMDIPQQPTHFIVRDILTGAMITPSQIPIASYGQAFNLTTDTNGVYVGATVMIEFINRINASKYNVLYGCPVDVTAGTYTAA